jgi:hypothetical protein
MLLLALASISDGESILVQQSIMIWIAYFDRHTSLFDNNCVRWINHTEKGIPQAMTTSPTFRNKAIVVGHLDTVLNRKRKETLLDTYRTLIDGQKHRIAVQLITTEGEPYALDLEVHPGIPGYDLLAGAAPETCLAFEGVVRLFTRYDARYAEGDDDAGRRVSAMGLDVRHIRAPRADEPAGASGVWLEGTVLALPRFERHYEQPSLQVGITLLSVQLDQEHNDGHAARSIQDVTVQVAVTTAYDQGGLLYRPGNRVRIDAELSCWMLPQHGAIVKRALAKRRVEHQTAVAATADQQQLSALTHQYRRDIQQLTLQATLLVMVCFVEAADASSTPISHQAVSVLRRAQAKRRRTTKAAQDR